MNNTIKKIHLIETESTNVFLRSYHQNEEDITYVTAKYQTAGRGQAGNSWESEDGKNLLFSILAKPINVELKHQFILSMACALAIKKVLDTYCEGISLKWPNDVYYFDKKICGILIEVSSVNGAISRCIFGVGLNVNQQIFVSNAPNPISLIQIIGKQADMSVIEQQILHSFTHYYNLAITGKYDIIRNEYLKVLYRKQGVFTFKDACEQFSASIETVENDGRLVLKDTENNIRKYYMKEVNFVITTK